MSTTTRQYVVCVRAEEAGDLEVRKLYEVRADASAAARGYVRVIDESGEDYLYPAEWFAAVEVPREADRALRASPLRSTSPKRANTPVQRTAQSRRR